MMEMVSWLVTPVDGMRFLVTSAAAGIEAVLLPSIRQSKQGRMPCRIFLRPTSSGISTGPTTDTVLVWLTMAELTTCRGHARRD